MKVTAYSIKPCEKEFITTANHNKHDITLISEKLTVATVSYAQGKDAILVFPGDDLSAEILQELQEGGVRYVVARSTSTDHIDLKKAESLGLKVANISPYSPESIAEHAITLILALSRNVIPAHDQMLAFDFSLDRLVGTTIRNKTIGVVGFGQTGQAMVETLKGFGCKILVADIADVAEECNSLGVHQVSLEQLYSDSQIISYHVPLTDLTRHMVDSKSIEQMQDGVMLINTSRGAVFNSIDVYNALQRDKISKLGMDVYEFENHIFFYDHTRDHVDDQLLKSFIQHSNVLLTPHQAFLTKEALKLVAERSIENLDRFELTGTKEQKI